MFKLYYNQWPITFVSRGTTWPQFFLQIFWYSKIEEQTIGQNIEITTSFFWWDIAIHNAHSPNPHDLNGQYKIHIINNLPLGIEVWSQRSCPFPMDPWIGIWTHETREFCSPTHLKVIPCSTLTINSTCMPMTSSFHKKAMSIDYYYTRVSTQQVGHKICII